MVILSTGLFLVDHTSVDCYLLSTSIITTARSRMSVTKSLRILSKTRRHIIPCKASLPIIEKTASPLVANACTN